MMHQSPVAPRDTGETNLLRKEYWCDISPESNHHHLLHRGSISASCGPKSVDKSIIGVSLKVGCLKERKSPIAVFTPMHSQYASAQPRVKVPVWCVAAHAYCMCLESRQVLRGDTSLKSSAQIFRYVLTDPHTKQLQPLRDTTESCLGVFAQLDLTCSPD